MPSRPVSHSIVVSMLAAVALLVGIDARAEEAREEVTRSFDRTLTITGSPILRLSHRNGDIRVRGQAGNEFRVHATIRVSAVSRSEASALADRIQIDVESTPTGVTVATRYPDYRRQERDLSFSVDYDVLVPDRMPIDVRNQFGDISVTGMKGSASILNASGRVTAADGSGRYDVQNAFGAIDVARLLGDLTIRGANGSVSATSVTGAISVANRFGTVTVSTIKGDALVNNSNGNVEATGITGNADLRATFGVITLRNVAKDARVENANGAITLADVDGTA